MVQQVEQWQERSLVKLLVVILKQHLLVLPLVQQLGVLEVQRLPQVISECENFAVFLEQMFEAVNKREALKDLPFDRKDAARTLKLFLGV